MTEQIDQHDGNVFIKRYDAVVDMDRANLKAEISRIFFAASSVQSFRDDNHRTAFHWLWLGRYLADEPADALVAWQGIRVRGYLVGSLRDPAQRREFDDLSYFRDFAPQTAQFPAHLHVNVDADVRGGGIGALLVERFADHAARAGVPGMHIVTGAGMRNVGFYERLGFSEVARAPRNGSMVVMLARKLECADR